MYGFISTLLLGSSHICNTSKVEPNTSLSSFETDELVAYNQQIRSVEFSTDGSKNPNYQNYSIECNKSNEKATDGSVSLSSQIVTSVATGNNYSPHGKQ